MHYTELQNRLRELGVDIPQRTLTDWARAGLIADYTSFHKITRRRCGCPRKSTTHCTTPTNKELQGGPGRFTDWSEEALEDAAAVWSIRQLKASLPAGEKRDVSNRAIMLAKHRAKSLYKQLTSNYPGGHAFFKLDFTPKKVREQKKHMPIRKDEEQWKFLQKYGGEEFAQSIAEQKAGNKGFYLISYEMHPLIVSWICAPEKVRRNIPITTPIQVTFDWKVVGGSKEKPAVPEFMGVRVEIEGVESDILQVNLYKPDLEPNLR